MKVISLSRPWPWTIFDISADQDPKRIENRGFRVGESTIGQRIALHAAKSWDNRAIAMCQGYGLNIPTRFDAHPEGAIVGIVTIDRVVQKSDSRWFFGPHGWEFSDVRKLPAPIKHTGAQGIRELPPAVTREVLAALGIEPTSWAIAGEVRAPHTPRADRAASDYAGGSTNAQKYQGTTIADPRGAERIRLLEIIYPLQVRAFNSIRDELGLQVRPLRPSGCGDFAERQLAALLVATPVMPTEEDLRHVLDVREAEARRDRSLRYFGSAMWSPNGIGIAMATDPAEVRRARDKRGAQIEDQLDKVAAAEIAESSPHKFTAQPGALAERCLICDHTVLHPLHDGVA